MIRNTLLLTAMLSGQLGVALASEPDLPRHQMILAAHSDVARTDYDIWTMCGDGTQLAPLFLEPGQQLQLDVSPDGLEIAYTSHIDDKRDVWRRPLGRGEPVNLTNHPADDMGPVWSPDGGRIAFFSDRDTSRPELYILELESGAIERLTENEWYDSGASWSPDGRTIVWTRFFPGDESAGEPSRGEIFMLDLVSGEERQLTELGGYNGGVAHSPDGREIVFHRTLESGSEIWSMSADGTNRRALTDTFIDEYSPQWSPDGNWIAYSAGTANDSRGTFDIWIMRPDGRSQQVLNKAANTQAWHRWRPGEHYCR